MSGAPLRLEVDGPVGTLILDRPSARNAMTRQMWRALPRLLGAAQNDKALRVLVVRGEGGSFCAGADITQMQELIDNPVQAAVFLDEMNAALNTLASFPRPVIARIDGPCIGAGLALALACDVRIAASDARFGVTPARLGLTYPLADTRRLVAQIGPARAKDLILSARLIDAQDAFDFGLVEQVIPAQDLARHTQDYALSMAQGSAHTQAAMKAMINAATTPDSSLEAPARDIFIQSFSGADFKEGFAAFKNKRKPEFRGS